jgi:hypothetical protein
LLISFIFPINFIVHFICLLCSSLLVPYLDLRGMK